ncbi:MAG: hypothetical protein J3K34DRAFT_462166 [Monoraphidium minutum]|nr:MAG: hypothetical protein J3K34DRAFT_462166 [Monoraphidium minutum]
MSDPPVRAAALRCATPAHLAGAEWAAAAARLGDGLRRRGYAVVDVGPAAGWVLPVAAGWAADWVEGMDADARLEADIEVAAMAHGRGAGAGGGPAQHPCCVYGLPCGGSGFMLRLARERLSGVVPPCVDAACIEATSVADGLARDMLLALAAPPPPPPPPPPAPAPGAPSAAALLALLDAGPLPRRGAAASQLHVRCGGAAAPSVSPRSDGRALLALVWSRAGQCQLKLTVREGGPQGPEQDDLVTLAHHQVLLVPGGGLAAAAGPALGGAPAVERVEVQHAGPAPPGRHGDVLAYYTLRARDGAALPPCAPPAGGGGGLGGGGGGGGGAGGGGWPGCGGGGGPLRSGAVNNRPPTPDGAGPSGAGGEGEPPEVRAASSGAGGGGGRAAAVGVSSGGPTASDVAAAAAVALPGLSGPGSGGRPARRKVSLAFRHWSDATLSGNFQVYADWLMSRPIDGYFSRAPLDRSAVALRDCWGDDVDAGLEVGAYVERTAADATAHGSEGGSDDERAAKRARRGGGGGARGGSPPRRAAELAPAASAAPPGPLSARAERLTFVLRLAGGTSFSVAMRPTQLCGRMRPVVAVKMGLGADAAERVTLRHARGGGRRIVPDDTPEGVGLVDGDVIDAALD